jgi:hypothetical protein
MSAPLRWAQDVLEGVSILLDGPLIAQGENIDKQALGQAVAMHRNRSTQGL